MKNITAKKFLRLLFTLVFLVVMSTVLLVSCTKDKNKDKKKEEPKKTEKELTKDLIIPNSDLNVIDDAKNEFPAPIKKWANKSIHSKNSSKIKAGGIYTDKDNYDKQSKAWDEQGASSELYNKIKAAPGEPKKLAMIYIPKNDDEKQEKGASAFALTNSFELSQGFLYKVSVDVMTYGLSGIEQKQDYYDEKVKKPGAWLSLTGGTTSKFKHVDTEGNWKTLTFYIRAPHRKTTLNLEMALGNLDKPDAYKKGYLATGHAFFGNIKAEKIAKNKFDDVVNEYNALSGENKKYAKFADMRLDNQKFEYYDSAYIGSSVAPDHYVVKRGTDKDDPNPPDVSARTGVIQAKRFRERWDSFGNNFNVPSGTSDTVKENTATKSRIERTFEILEKDHGNATKEDNIFVLSQSMMSALELQSRSKITIEPGKKYRLSVWLYTYNINGAGVTLFLKGENGADITLKGISKNPIIFDNNKSGALDSDKRPYATDGASTGDWKEFTFEIDASKITYECEYTFAIALGTGGPKANHKLNYPDYNSEGKITTKEMYNGNGTFSSGYVFVNNLKFENITALSEAATSLSSDGNYYKDGEVSTTIAVKLEAKADNTNKNDIDKFDVNTANDFSSNTEGLPNEWKLKEAKGDYYINKDWAKAGVVDLANPTKELKNFIGKDAKIPDLPYDATNKKVMMLSIKDYPASMFVDTKKSFDIDPYTITKVSFHIHTSLVDEFYKAGFISFYTKDEDDKNQDLTSFSDIKTKGKNEYYNEWEEITLCIKNSTDKKQKIFMSVSLGKSVLRYKPEEGALGTLFFTTPTFNQISNNAYANASDDNKSKKYHILAERQQKFDNQHFNKFDLSKLDAANFTSNGKLKNAPAIPEGWESSDKTFKDDDFINGIVEFERGTNNYAGTGNPSDPTDPAGIKEFIAGTHIDEVFGADKDKFEGIYGDVHDNFFEYQEERGYLNHRMLVLGAKSGSSKKFSYGYTSKKILLQSDKFFKISVFARSIDNANFTISLLANGLSSIDNSNKVITQKGSNGMQRYDFYVRTGIEYSNVQLSFWLGYNNKKYTQAEAGNLASHESAGYAVLSGILVYGNISESEFNSVPKTERNAKLEINEGAFDISVFDAEKHSSLLTPNGWESSYKSSNVSKSGLLSSDLNVLTRKEDDVNTEGFDESKYLDIFGTEKYTDEQFKPTISEVENSKWLDSNVKNPEFDGLTDDKIAEKLSKQKFVEYAKTHWLEATNENVTADGGNSSYVLYNKANATSILKKKSVTLKSNSIYKISIKLRTKLIRGEMTDEEFKERGAFLKLKFNEHNAPVEFRSIKVGEFTEYVYIIKTPGNDISTTITASLGREGADAADEEQYKTAGWLFMKSVTINKVAASEFVENADSATKKYVKLVDAPKSGNKDKNDKEIKKEEKAPSFNTEYLWWMIPTIILGVLIIAVIIVFIYKKFKKKKGKSLIDYLKDADDNSSSALEEKHIIYTEDDSEKPNEE